MIAIRSICCEAAGSGYGAVGDDLDVSVGGWWVAEGGLVLMGEGGLEFRRVLAFDGEGGVLTL